MTNRMIVEDEYWWENYLNPYIGTIPFLVMASLKFPEDAKKSNKVQIEIVLVPKTGYR